MNVLVDTNVILNVLTKRNDVFLHQSEEIFRYAIDEKFNGFVSSHSFPIMWYVLRKGNNEDHTRQLLEMVCNIFDVVNLSRNTIKQALQNRDFHDFEDCLQDECADIVNADYLVTCNFKDFVVAKTAVLNPDEFLEKLAILL